MPRLEYFLVADEVIVDQATNRASAINILEQVGATSFPTTLRSATVLALWCPEPSEESGDFQSVLKITLPDGDFHELRTNFTMRARRHRLTQTVATIPLAKPGVLKFDLALGSHHAASHVVDVLMVDEPGD